MDDRIRVSDADRDRVTARLRDHFAEGRLTHSELDERITAALNAKTVGDLRRLMADLPGPIPVPQAAQRPQPAAPPWIARRRRPRVLPLILLVMIAALLIPEGGWLLFAFLKLILVFWLVACLAGFVIAGRFRRRMDRHGYPGYPHRWHGPARWR
ncbi:MAG TPA: hypothetical protein DHU96_09515 [Actinobacteria bacterium]|nr:hypothetical protein [Actinomycetota bacterium]